MKTCFKCGEAKPLEDFYAHTRMADGHLNKCKVCTKLDSTKRYRERFDGDPEWRERQRARGREKYHRYKYRKRKMARHKAANTVANAVRDGRVERRSKCEGCGATGRLERHHPDYNKPLEVVWLCTVCHGKRHRRRA